MDNYQDRDAEKFIGTIETALNDLGLGKGAERFTFKHFTPSISVGRRYLGVYDRVIDRNYLIEINAVEREV